MIIVLIIPVSLMNEMMLTSYDNYSDNPTVSLMNEMMLTSYDNCSDNPSVTNE